MKANSAWNWKLLLKINDDHHKHYRFPQYDSTTIRTDRIPVK